MKSKPEFPDYKKLSVTDLVPYARNSRTHSPQQVDKIAASIREFGFLNPIIVDGMNGIVAGHGRVLAAQKLGLSELPVIYASHLSAAQKRAYVIADNRLALDAGWDNEMLKIELQDLEADGFDLSLTGFELDEIGDLLAEPVTGLTDEDAVPEVPVVPVTVEGDVWVLGRHRLMCGDSTNIDHLERLCDGQLVDMWLTDPPYNVAYEGGTKEKLTIKNDSMGNDAFRQFLRDAYFAADAVMKKGAVFYIWHADSEGYNFRGAAHLWAADRKQTTILEFSKPSRNAEHPTMKPVELFEYQMLNNTKGSDLVLDSFAGSGTTAIACEKHGRNARLMELDPKYCDVIVKRWQDFTGQQAALEATGEAFEVVAGGRA